MKKTEERSAFLTMNNCKQLLRNINLKLSDICLKTFGTCTASLKEFAAFWKIIKEILRRC